MEIDLRALQLQVESENSIEACRNTLTNAVKFFSSIKDNDLKVKAVFEIARDKLDYDSIEDKDIFFYDSDELLPSDVPGIYKAYNLGMFNADGFPIFRDRLVYPVRDVRGYVMGLCGWDLGGIPKYLDSRNYGYNAKNNCLFGMEKLEEYYKSDKPIFITEGIVCCLYLRSKGFNALALLGSSISTYVIEILKRFKDRCILLPDNDKAGLSVLKTAKYKLKDARCYVSKVAKDIDDTRKLDDNKYEEALLKDLSMAANPFHTMSILAIQK